MCSELGKGATSDEGKYLVRAANVGWRFAQFLLLPLVTRCLYTLDVCILWNMFVFYVCCDCVGVCGNVCWVAAIVEDSVFLVLEC